MMIPVVCTTVQQDLTELLIAIIASLCIDYLFVKTGRNNINMTFN